MLESMLQFCNTFNLSLKFVLIEYLRQALATFRRRAKYKLINNYGGK